PASEPTASPTRVSFPGETDAGCIEPAQQSGGDMAPQSIAPWALAIVVSPGKLDAFSSRFAGADQAVRLFEFPRGNWTAPVGSEPPLEPRIPAGRSSFPGETRRTRPEHTRRATMPAKAG